MSSEIADFRVGPTSGDSRTRAPAGQRNWSSPGHRFRRKPPLNARGRRQKTRRRNLIDPRREFLTRSQNPDFRAPPTTPPEIADFRVGPKLDDLRAGRLSNASPRRSAQLANFRTPSSPETSCKTRDRDAKKRARPAATPFRLPPAGYPPPATHAATSFRFPFRPLLASTRTEGKPAAGRARQASRPAASSCGAAGRE